MQFWRLARNGISPPYFPVLPSSTRMKCEWLLSRQAPSDKRLEVMWYGTTPCVKNEFPDQLNRRLPSRIQRWTPDVWDTKHSILMMKLYIDPCSVSDWLLLVRENSIELRHQLVHLWTARNVFYYSWPRCKKDNTTLYSERNIALTLLSIKSVLWFTMPQVAMPIKCSCDALSFNSCAPRDMTVWPLTASPTWRITPVFVPPVIIHAPVVCAACGTYRSYSCIYCNRPLNTLSLL